MAIASTQLRLRASGLGGWILSAVRKQLLIDQRLRHFQRGQDLAREEGKEGKTSDKPQ